MFIKVAASLKKLQPWAEIVTAHLELKDLRVSTRAVPRHCDGEQSRADLP